MSRFVVDASAGMKWFVAEGHADAARRLQDPAHELHVPTFFDVEMANIAWKKMLRGEINRIEADFILNQLPLLTVVRHPEAPLLTVAFDLAAKTQRTVYDCLYLALALQLAGQMVTADDRLVNALAGTAWAGNILRLQDVP
ncbi:MAG: type II toxin-antitoxin system VapC family toxin [Planctomycetes bacterium]|nr:type II toxin-antitoxin system VapC family toxin [Planctomycetota bacterium]